MSPVACHVPTSSHRTHMKYEKHLHSTQIPERSAHLRHLGLGGSSRTSCSAGHMKHDAEISEKAIRCNYSKATNPFFVTLSKPHYQTRCEILMFHLLPLRLLMMSLTDAAVARVLYSNYNLSTAPPPPRAAPPASGSGARRGARRAGYPAALAKGSGSLTSN